MSQSEIGTVVGDATIVNYFEQNSSYLLNFSVGDTQKAYLASRNILDYSAFGIDGTYSGPGVVDAEKRTSTYFPKDADLCWAGAAANILEFSGWGDVAGLSNEDDIYDFLKNAFAANNNETLGGSTMGAVDWFVNGTKYSALGTSPKFYTSGAEVKNYACDINLAAQLQAAMEGGNAIGLSVSFLYHDGSPTPAGHALTIFGFTYDERYDITDPRYLTGVFIADSDDSKDQLDSRASQNTLTLVTVEWNEELGAYCMPYYGGGATMTVLNYIHTIEFRPLEYAEDPDKAQGNFVSIKEGEISYNAQLGGKNETRLQIVGSGAIAVSANVGYNGIQRVLGMASDTVVSGSGAVTALQDVRSGGVAYGGKILAGGEQYVSGGGVASGTLVGKDGTQVIYSGASALDVTVASGGVQKVGDSGSVVRDTVVESGGAQLLTGGASATGTVVETSGVQTIEDGAIGVFDRIHGIQFVNGGSAVDTVIESTGLQTISGGEVLRAQVHGEQYLTNGAAVSATVHAGGEVLQTGGVFEDGYVSSGGVVMGVGGQVTGLTILSYGVQLVASDAVASNTVIRNRGFQYVQNGGSAVGGKVAGYGYVYAGEGAQVKNYQFAAYGSAVIDSGAVVSDFTMGSGAMISVLDGGTATNVALAEGARLNTIFGTGITAAVNGTNANGSFSVENGTAVNLLIARDALAVAADGAMAQNITIENGGLLAVTGYAVLAGTTVIAGQLQVTGYAEAQDVVIDLAGQAPSGAAFISDSALLSFESLTVDVSAVGSNGRYKLAGNAREFVCAVTVQDSAGYQLMEVGDSWIGSDGYYELLISGGGELMLSVSVFNSGMTDPVVSVNTAETTSSEVVLTVVYDENAVSKLYSFNGSDWFDYTGDITVTENGTYYFRGVAADGSSAITRYEVSNFDPEALSLPVITASSTGPTVGYITLSAVFDEDATANYYSFDGSIWYEYDGDVKVTGNGDVYFRSMNGNYTVTQTYTVDNIVSFIKEEGTSATPRPGNFTTGIPARDELAYAYVLTTTPAQIVANRDVYIFTNTDHEEDGGRFVNADNGNYALAILTNGAMLTIGGNPTSQMPNIYCRRPELTNNTSSEGAGGTTPVKSYGVIFEGDTNYLAFSEATGGVTSQDYSDRAIWILCEGSDATALSGNTVYVLGNLAGTLQGMGETTFNFTEDMVPYGTWEEDPESGELVFKLGNFRLPANMSSISNSAYATGAAITGDLVIGNDFSGIIEAQSTVDKTVDLALSAKWATESQQSHVTLGDTNGTVSASALTVGGELQLSAGDFAGEVIATASNSRYLFSTIEWEDEPAEDEGGEEGEEGGGSSDESKDDNVARSGVVTGQKFLAAGIQAGSVDTAWFSGDVTAEVQNNVFSLDMTYNTSVASSIRMGGMTFSAVAVSVGSLTIGNSFTGSLTATVRDITMDMIWDDSRTKGDGDPISLTLTYDANTIKGVGLEVTDTLTIGGNFGGSIKINGGEFSYNATRFGIGPDEKALDFNPSSYLYAGLLADNINIKGSLSSDISFTCYDTSFGQAPAAFFGVVAGVADSVSHATLKVLTAADFSGSITVDAESGNSGLWVTGMGATVYYNGNDNIFDIAGTIDTGSALEAYALVSSAMSFRISGKVVSKDYAVYHNPGDTGYDLQTEADYLEVAAGGEVYGNIGFGDTTNTMVIDSNATVIGSLLTTMGAIDLVFNLNDQAMSGTAKSSGVALTVGNSLVLTTTSITVNLNDATAGKSYALIQDENMERWLGQVITVNYQGSEADLVIGGSTAGFGFSVSADVIDNQLVISVDELAEGLAGDAPTALKVTSINSEGSARLAWTSATRGAVSVLEYRINGKGSVVVETTASDFRLYGLEEGDLVEWRVREESDKGAVTGAWSETESFTVGGGSAIVGAVRSLSCKKISGAVAKLDWSDVYCSEGLAYYEVRYCQTAGTPTWADGTYVSKTVTASELLISNLGSSETVYCQVRTVDKDGNAGEWASVGTGGNLKVDKTPMVFTYGTNLEVESVSCGDDSCDVNFSWGIAQEVGSVQSGFDSYVLCFQKGTYSVTSDNTPVFTLDASASLYSITINDQYTTDVFYNTATDGLAEGTYLWWVDAYDQAGNVTETGQSRFLVDFTAPQGSFRSLDQPVVTVLRGGTDDDSGNNNYESDEEGDGEEPTPVVGEVSSARVSFSWDANFTDNLSAVSYRVDISSDKYFSVNKSFSFYTDSMSLTLDSSNENSVGALLGKDTVYWRVVAVDECGNESLASAVQSFQFIDEATQSAIVETTAPSEILLFEAEQRGNRMHFDWSAAYDAFGVKNYRLSLKKKNGATEIITVDGGETSFEYKNLADGIYSVSITAVNYAGLSSEAAVISNLVMDTVAPVMPDKVEGRVLGSDICISWDAAEDNIKVAGYELTFSKVKTVTSQGVTSWSVLTTQTVRVDAKELDYWMYSVSDGNYVYSVRAFDGSGNYSVASTETLLTVNAAGSPGSSFNTAMLVTSGETYHESVGGSSLADYYLIDCSSYYNPGQVEITIDDVAPVGSSKKSNIRVTLYNENRKKIASKSLSSGTYSLAQLFDGTNPKYGNSFYLVVEASNGKNYMSYNATISTKAFPDATENNSIAAATVIAPPAPAETITGWVGYGDATDCYSLTLTELSGAGQVTLSLGETKAKTKLTVYNAAGKRVKSFSVAAGKAQTYTFFAVEDAVSYIEVTSGDNGKGKQNTYYDLVTSVAYNEKMVFAGSEGSVDGTLAAGETKYYTIDPAAGLADIKLSGMSQSVTMALYDATGKKLKSFSSKKAKTVLGDYLLTEGCYLSVTAKKATDYKVDFSMEYSKPVTVVAGTGSVSGAVSAADQMDIYEFAGGGVCSLSLSGMSQSVTVTLYSSTGKKLKSFSSKKAKTGIADYMAGDDTYYVTVSGKKDSNYTLTLDMVSEVTVDLTTGTKRVSGKIVDSSTDCYRVLADASGKLTVSLAGDGANVSAALYDSTGKKVKSLSSKDANGKLVLSAYGLKDSEYNLVVTAKGTADYSVLLAPSEDPAANTFAGARVLTEGELVDEWVGTNDALDIFAFTAETAGKLDIDVEFFSDLQSAGTTADVRLFNAGGVELSLDDALSTNVLAGTYFIEVEAINSRKNRDIGYSIAVDLK